MEISEAIQKAIEGGWDFYRDQLAEGETENQIKESKKSIPNPDSVSIEDGEGEFEIHGKVIHLHWDDEDAVGWENQDLAFPLEKTAYLNPLFWQALGKSMGWKGTTYVQMGTKINENVPDWRYHWHRLLDFLAEGKSIEEYFTLLDA